MSDAEKSEALLTYFGEIIRPMTKSDLLALRARLEKLHPGTAEHATVLQVIDGGIALRDIERSP